MMILALALAAASTPAPAMSDPDLAAARKVLFDHLRDPDHAKVRNFRKVSETQDTAHPASYCGEINAPNAYGGLTGWHLVRVTVNGNFMEDDGPWLTHDVLTSLCPVGSGGGDVTAAFTPAS